MALSGDISIIENRLRAARIPLGRMFELAGVDRSSWSRWRSESVSPTLNNWRAVLAAVEELAPVSAASTLSAVVSPSRAGELATPVSEGAA